MKFIDIKNEFNDAAANRWRDRIMKIIVLMKCDAFDGRDVYFVHPDNRPDLLFVYRFDDDDFEMKFRIVTGDDGRGLPIPILKFSTQNAGIEIPIFFVLPCWHIGEIQRTVAVKTDKPIFCNRGRIPFFDYILN